MAKSATKRINGVEYTFQSVSPNWYMDNIDRFGRGKNTRKYIDELIKNVVVSPAEVAREGMDYFHRLEDTATPVLLMEEIESFLAKPDESGRGTEGSTTTY